MTATLIRPAADLSDGEVLAIAWRRHRPWPGLAPVDAIRAQLAHEESALGAYRTEPESCRCFRCAP